MGELMPWGEWKPDVSPYKGQHSPTITNAIPRGDGYGPMNSLNPMSQALADTCRGSAAMYADDGTISLFAGTADRLWLMSNTDMSWIDVSAGGAAYSSVPPETSWRFGQFGSRALAVNGNVPAQYYDLGGSSAFAALPGNPPIAKYVSVVGAFVVLTGLTSDEYTMQWSSRNNTAEWIPGTNEGDLQTFRDGGMVRGVTSGEYGLVFQDRAIRRMVYAPGSAVIFEFDVVSRDFGLWAPQSLVQVRDMAFFLSDQGFVMWQPMTGFKPIGAERVDRTFMQDCDTSQKHMIVGALDPGSTRIIWSYKSTSHGVNNTFDRLIVYDWLLDRWAGWIDLPGEYIMAAANPGITLESLDSISTNISTMTLSFDDYPQAFGNRLAMVNSAHVLGLLSGATLEVTLETAEIDIGSRALVSGCRPITDSPDVLTSIAGKPRVMDSPFAYSQERAVTSIGTVPCRVDNRVLKFRNRFPAGSTWSYSIGVEPDMQPTGMR